MGHEIGQRALFDADDVVVNLRRHAAAYSKARMAPAAAAQ